MKKALYVMLTSIVVLVLAPTFSSYLLGMWVNNEDDKSTTAILLIAALLNSTFVWWLIWKVFCS